MTSALAKRHLPRDERVFLSHFPNITPEPMAAARRVHVGRRSKGLGEVHLDPRPPTGKGTTPSVFFLVTTKLDTESMQLLI